MRTASPGVGMGQAQKKFAIERVPVSLSGGCFRVGVDGKGEISRLDGVGSGESGGRSMGMGRLGSSG